MLEIRRYWTEEVRSELDSMIGQVRALASSNAYCFCCGEMGNIDFLLDYSEAAHTSEAAFEIRSELIRTVESILLFTSNGGGKSSAV